MESTEAKETKSILTGLLTSTPLRCTIQQLCNDFNNTIGYAIPFRKLGFSNVEAYLRSIPGTVRVIGSGLSAEVQGVITEKSAHINIMVAKQRKDSIPAHKKKNIKNFLQSPRASYSNRNTSHAPQNTNQHFTMYEDDYQSRIPKRIQNNLRKLIIQFPDGIWCTQLKAEYQKMFQEDISFEKFGFRSLTEMCTDLSDIFHYIQTSTEDFMLYDKNKAIPSFNQNELPKNRETGENRNAEINWALSSDLVPNDIVPYLQLIPQISLDDIRAGDSLQINISEIYDVNNFWIFPQYGDLELVKREFQTSFCNRNKYVIPIWFFHEGLYCAVYYKDSYHRGVIVDTMDKNPTDVKVLFIDYGSIGEVRRTDVWYLPKQFGQVPSQAIRAGLSNIKSNGNSVETTNKFKQFIRNAELVAEVMKIDKQERRLDLYLANVANPEEIFYVNDALVEKGYAEYCSQ